MLYYNGGTIELTPRAESNGAWVPLHKGTI